MTSDPLARFREAIASIESRGSGDYRAVGPTHQRLGRALGRYQIMEANLGPWSREALGREVTADEFMASPEMQDAIFNHQFGRYVDRFGPEGAAQAWFAGEGGVGRMDRRDSLGTSVADYTRRFTNALGGAGAGAGAGMSPGGAYPGQTQTPGPGNALAAAAQAPEQRRPVNALAALDPAAFMSRPFDYTPAPFQVRARLSGRM